MTLAKTISGIALAAVILPAVFFMRGWLTLPFVQWTSLLATIVWFAVTPIWMGKEIEERIEAKDERREETG